MENDPLQTGKIETGRIETVASRLAALNNAASNPKVDGIDRGNPQEYQSPGMYDPGAARGDTTHPWQITNNDGELSVLGGYVFESGISTDPDATVENVTELTGDKAWLKITANDGYSVTSAIIEAGDAWPATMVGSTLPYILYIPLGQVVSDEVQQFRRDHIFLAAAQGTPGVILIPR